MRLIYYVTIYTYIRDPSTRNRILFDRTRTYDTQTQVSPLECEDSIIVNKVCHVLLYFDRVGTYRAARIRIFGARRNLEGDIVRPYNWEFLEPDNHSLG